MSSVTEMGSQVAPRPETEPSINYSRHFSFTPAKVPQLAAASQATVSTSAILAYPKTCPHALIPGLNFRVPAEILPS